MGILSRRPRADAATGDWFVAFQDAIAANKSFAGVSVTQDSAHTLPAVYRCMSINSDTVSTMPVGAYRKVNGKSQVMPLPRWMESPNDDMDWGVYIGQMQSSLEADGNGFALRAVAPGGQLAGLYPLNPECVRVDRSPEGGRVYYLKQYGGEEAEVRSNEMLHVQAYTPAGALRGMSPISAMKQAIGLGLATQQYGAQFFGEGATLSGVIKTVGNMQLEQQEKMKETFKKRHGGISKSHAIGILTGGAEWVPLSVKPDEAQFLETRRFNAGEIACAFGVPAWLVTDVEGAKGYVSGLYATMYMWLLTGINVRLVRLERAHTRLLADKTAYVKFNRNAFLAMDPTERSAYYAGALAGRYMVPNEVRDKEDMDPLPGGDEALWSVQWGADPAKVTGGAL
jgi:HK97 family phage portal protein